MTRLCKRHSRDALRPAGPLDVALESWAQDRRPSTETFNDIKARVIDFVGNTAPDRADVTPHGVSIAYLIHDLCGVEKMQQQLHAIESSCAFLNRLWWKDDWDDYVTA